MQTLAKSLASCTTNDTGIDYGVDTKFKPRYPRTNSKPKLL